MVMEPKTINPSMTQFSVTLLALTTVFHMLFQTAVASAIAKPGCPDNCGGIPIPYPFGIGPGCSLEGFELSCNNTLAFLNDDVEVMNIDINAGQARVLNSIASRCYYLDLNRSKSNPVSMDLSGTPYRLNTMKNKFIVVGCNNLAYISFYDGTNLYLGGFVEDCNANNIVIVNGSCTGVGCWQTAIPTTERDNFHIDFAANYSHSEDASSQCGYAVLMEEAAYLFNSANITAEALDYMQTPLVLDWAIRKETCDVARANRSSYACRSYYSVCVDSPNGLGYLCNCSNGYAGNPYLEGGCQDIDECASLNPCAGKCHNLPGSYECSCPGIMHLKKHPAGQCEIHVPFLIGTIIVLGFGTGFIILLIYFIIAWRIKLFEKRRQEKLKQKFFVKNRGLLLQHLIDSHDTTQKMRIFGIDELERATNRFDNALILGRGGHGEVYKGILSDQRVVAIKRSKIVDQSEIDQFINEVVILSQVNHRNVVKLFGCCLETEVPLLVYEFISNGTLFNHLHIENNCALTWKHRLKISLEAAGAISYLHSSAPISVFHRDLKSSNILLDDYFTAKVSDFGASRSVHIDQTGITTAIQGTHGYLDPEYYYTGRLTQKSDVYSFGVILIELLTREKPVLSSSTMCESGSLIAYFSSAMNENRLFEILDPDVVYEENRTELESVAKLAEMCLRMRGEERPTMKEVEVRLEVLWRSNKQHEHPWTSQSLEEREPLLFDSALEIDISQEYSFE